MDCQPVISTIKDTKLHLRFFTIIHPNKKHSSIITAKGNNKPATENIQYLPSGKNGIKQADK